MGTVEAAGKTMENTLGYQMTMFGNSLTSIWDIIGNKILPIVQEMTTDINNNMDRISQVVNDELAPAFYDLANMIAYAFGLDDVSSFADGIITVIKVASGFIKAITWITYALIKTYDVAKIFVKSLYAGILILVEGFIVLGSAATGALFGIINILMQVSLAVGYVAEGLVRSFDDALILLGKGFLNLGKVISDALIWGAKKGLNGLIVAYNNTIGELPGMPKINGLVNDFGGSTGGYISVANQWTGLQNAWTKDNVFLGVMKETQGNFNDAYKTLWNFNITDLFTSMPKASDYTNDIIKKDRVQAPGKTGGKPGAGPSNTKGNEGYSPTKADQDAAKKAEDDAKKAEEERLKNKQEYFKNLIDLEKKNTADLIKADEDAQAKKWKLMDDTKELYQDQIKFYKDLKNKYILTTDEMIDINNKQWEAAKNLRDKKLSDFKKSLDEQLKLQKKASNDKIREYQGYLDAIDKKLSDNERENSNTDAQDEITKLEKQYEKYKNASSIEGIAKRREIEEELKLKRKEQGREKTKQTLEDEKTRYTSEIEKLNNTMTDTENKYNDMYANLENTVNSKEAFIASTRKNSALEANKEIKKSLDQLVKDYTNSYKQIDSANVSNITLQNAKIMDAKRMWTEGNLTGDEKMKQTAEMMATNARNAGGTIKSTDQVDPTKIYGVNGSPDYKYFKTLGPKWMDLEKTKTGDKTKDDPINALQASIHAEAERLRAKYNVAYPQDIPQYPKFHEGGVVRADLLNGEAVLTNPMFEKLVDFIDGLQPSTGLNKNSVKNPTTVNNTTNINIGQVNNNSNADFEVFTQKLNHLTDQKNRATGTRTI